MAIFGTLFKALNFFEQLERFKDIAKDFPDTEHFRININLGWQKLNEYYEILSETPIYYAGLALHPAYRWKWFERNWTDRPEWIDEAKNMVHDVWRFEYREAALPDRSHQPLSQFPSSGRLRTIRFRNTLNETATQRQKQVMVASRQAKTNTCIGLRTAKVVMAPSTILSLTGTRSDSSIQTYREWRLIFSRYNQCLLSVSVFSQQQVGW